MPEGTKRAVDLEPGHRLDGGNRATLPCENLSGEAETLGWHPREAVEGTAGKK